MSTSFASPPTDAASRAQTRRPWHLAVIGSVAALAVAIGLAAGSFLTTNRTLAVGAAAEYVPATATLYVEIRIEPSQEQDAALRELLGRFPPINDVDLDRPLTDQLADLLDEALAGEELDLSWSEDVAPWTDGRLAFAMLEIPREAFDPMADPTAVVDAPPALALLGVSDVAAARASVERILAEADAPPLTTTEHRGVTIHAADGEGAYAITDDHLIVAPSTADIVTALDAAASDATLAAREDVASLVATLPSDWLAFGVFDFTEAMASALEAADTESAAGSAAMARILEHQSLRAAFAVRATDEGFAFDVAGVPPTGPFALENVDRGLAAAMPADTLYYAEGGNIGAGLAEIVAALKEGTVTEPEAEEAIRTAEAALGADLEELVAWVDDGALAIGFDGNEPYAGLVLVPTDVSAAQRRLDQLATFAGLAALDPASGVSVSAGEVGGVTVTTIAWQDPQMSEGPMGMPVAISVQYAISDENLVLVGVGERFVGRVLDLDPVDSLTSVDRYTDAIASLGGPAHAGAAWMDLAGIVEAVSELAGPMLGPDVSEELFAWLRPLDRMVSVAQLDGEVLVQRSVLLVR